MSFSTFQIYLRAFFPHVPLWHWIDLVILAIAVMTITLIRKRNSVYGAVVLGLAVASGLALLDALVFIRIGGQHKLHPGIDLGAEWQRLTSDNEEILILMLFNAAVFIPFGMAVEEAFAAKNVFSRWKCLGFVALIAFALSLCIESLQLVLHIGMFEVTDLVLNTVGAVLGGALAFGIRRILTINHV